MSKSFKSNEFLDARLSFIKGLKLEKMIKQDNCNYWVIGPYKINRLSMEIAPTKTLARKLSDNGKLVAWTEGDVIAGFGCHYRAVEREYNKFLKLNNIKDAV